MDAAAAVSAWGSSQEQGRAPNPDQQIQTPTHRDKDREGAVPFQAYTHTNALHSLTLPLSSILTAPKVTNVWHIPHAPQFHKDTPLMEPSDAATGLKFIKYPCPDPGPPYPATGGLFPNPVFPPCQLVQPLAAVSFGSLKHLVAHTGYPTAEPRS